MNKPLKDWTLGEIKQECKKHPGACCIKRDCPFIDDVGCTLEGVIGDVPPYMWDLSEPSRWTEQDREDAKALKRLIARASYVRRDGSYLKLYDDYGQFVSVLWDCFAALPPETIVTLNEIIGGAE